MSKKVIALALLVILALSSFGVAFADNYIVKDADRNPLDASITLCKLQYPADTTDTFYGSISWKYSVQNINGVWEGNWYPVDANIIADPANWTGLTNRYGAISDEAKAALVAKLNALNIADWMSGDVADAIALDAKLGGMDEAAYKALPAKVATVLNSILLSKAAIVKNKAELMLDQNVVYNRAVTPAFSVKQVGNVVLLIGSETGIIAEDTAVLDTVPDTDTLPKDGDVKSFYVKPIMTLDVRYADSAVRLGDYITANTAGHYFDLTVIPGVTGNMNLNTDPLATLPSYTQAAWSHQHAQLSELNFDLSTLMINNFDDHNTVILSTFHGEFASQYQFVYVNAPANTQVLDNTLKLSATTDTKDVTLTVDGNYIIATYGNIAADTINFKLSAADRYMNIRFNNGSTDYAQDLRLYADYTRWDNEDAASYDNTVATVDEAKLPGSSRYNIIGLVNYADVKYVVIQPVVLAQNPTKAASIAVGAPYDLRNGAKAKMEIVTDPANALFAGTLTYESLTPEICTVDADGVVTGVKAGTGYILVTGKDTQGAAMYYTKTVDGKYQIDTSKMSDLEKKLKIEITVSDKAALFMKNAVIVGTDAPIYKKAEANSDYYGIVAVGTIIDYSSETKVVNGFLEVVHNGGVAYIKMGNISFEMTSDQAKDAVAPETTPAAPVGTKMTVSTKGGMLNVRNAPNGAIVAKLANGTVVTVVDTTNAQWFKLDTGNYVASAYLK